MVAVPAERQAFLDAVLADAEGRRDQAKYLEKDPAAWRDAIADLLDDIRSQLTVVNADMRANAPRSYRRHELEQTRADLAGTQASLETRLGTSRRASRRSRNRRRRHGPRHHTSRPRTRSRAHARTCTRRSTFSATSKRRPTSEHTRPVLSAARDVHSSRPPAGCPSPCRTE